MIVLGIDPGLDGSAAIYRPHASVASGLRWSFLDIPTVGEKAARRIDVHALFEWAKRFAPEYAYIENVGPMPFQSPGSTARFLRASGALEATAALCVGKGNVRLIAPVRWKRFFEIPAYGKARQREAKEHSRLLMLQLAPELADVLALKKSHGRAESALLAYYGAYHLSR